MKKKRGHEEPENQERWLLTYADLITLLLGLFVILYAMSKVDAAKYAEVAAALGGVFGSDRGKIVVVQGGAGILQLPVPPKNEQQEVQRLVENALHLDIDSGLISIASDERGVTVHVMEQLAFASGKADPTPAMLNVVDTLASILKLLPYDVRVEGHTDDIPINTPVFRSNWHLSIARAVNVAYYFIEKHNLNQEKISVAGFGEFHPLVPNLNAANRARNRRVDIVIMAKKENPSGGHLDSSAMRRSAMVVHP
jgi:chemotaxis protein MotB